MEHIKQFAEKWQRDIDNNFATACYNDNTIAELEKSHTPADADRGDCKNWGITPQEWSEAIEAALRQKLATTEE
jgi:hypothetical protein